MSTSTTNYSFTLPAVADPIDEDLWGAELNSNWSSLDDILPTPAANKYGAIAVQNNADNGLDYITSQGTSGQALISNGADALPSFQSITATILDAVYPVGSLYMNKTVSTNPNTLFGFGTWVAITDRFIMSRGSTYTGTGGAATVSLSAANNGPHQHDTRTYGGAGSNGTWQRIAEVLGSNNAFDTTTTDTVQSSGSGTPFSIIPPYQAVYCWERTA